MTSPAPHQAIYRRWRAQTFGEIVGQEAVVETLRNAVRTDHVSHAVLFVGPRGTGKTSLARILAKALNCTNIQDGDACDACPSCIAIREGTTLDLVEIDAASNRGIDAVRELRERLPYPPGELRRKVYILDEAHQITKDAWNALLKSLEEPPDFVSFMFASTEPSGFPAPIISRLQRYDVRRLTTAEIEGKLDAHPRGRRADGDPEALRLIARLAAGGMRDAESMLDQLLSSAPDSIDERRVRDLLGLADADAVDGFVDALVAGDAAAGSPCSTHSRSEDATRGRCSTRPSKPSAPVSSKDSRPAMGRCHRAWPMRPGVLPPIDPDRAGVGGLRLQLELALFSVRRQRRPLRRVRRPSPPRQQRLRRRAARRRSSPPARVRVATPEPTVSTQPPAIATPEPPTREATTPDATAEPAVEPTEAAAADPAEPVATEATATEAGTTEASPERAEPEPAGSEQVQPPTPDEPEPVAASGPATPTEPRVEPRVTAPAPVGSDLAALLAAWPEVVARLSADPPTKPLINACRPVAVDGSIVTLGFPEEQSFLKDAIERRRAKIEAGIGESLGREVSVRCVVANIEVAPPPDPRSEGAYVMAEAQDPGRRPRRRQRGRLTAGTCIRSAHPPD